MASAGSMARSTARGSSASGWAMTASRLMRAPTWAAVARATGRRLLAAPQRLEQGALLDARAARQQLQVAVAAHRIGDGAQRGQHRGHELLAARHGGLVVARGGAVDEELHDGLRVLGGLAPDVGVVADDLVGIATVGQAHHVDVGEAAAVGRALDLADQRGQLGGTEGRRALPGSIDVIGQRDARRVAREQLHLARGERGAHAADDVLEARPGGP